MKYFLKKNLVAMIISFVIIIFAILSPLIVESNFDIDYMSFSTYHINVDIEEDGDILVKETIVGNFEEGMHVLFKDLPYAKNNNGQIDNESSFDTNSVIVKITNNQNTVIYDSANSIDAGGVDVGYSWNNDHDELGGLIACPIGYGSDCVSIFTYVSAGISPRTTYEFTYRIQGAVSSYADIAELNWNFYNPSESMAIRDVEVKINYPSAVTNIDQIYFYGHGARGGQVDEITVDYTTFSYAKLYPTDVIEMRLLFPSSLVTSPRSGTFLNENKLDYFLDLEAAIEQTDTLYYYGDFIGLILAILVILFLALLTRKIYYKYDKEHIAEFSDEYYRELPAKYPPAEMGYLYNFRDIGNADLSATLMDLIRRKYVTVDYLGQSTTDEDADYTLIYNPNLDRSSLTKYEEFLLNWFFVTIAGKDNKVSLSEIEKYAKAQATAEKYLSDNTLWTQLLKREARKRDFFDVESEKVLFNQKNKLIIISIISILFIVFSLNHYMYKTIIGFGFVLAVVVTLISYYLHIKRRSLKGNEEYVRWRAFKKFLSEFSHFDDYSVPSIVIWEHYLVYAVAFGIADLVNKQLNLRYGENLPEGYTGSPFIRHRYMPTYMFLRLNSYHRVAQQTVQKMQSNGKGGRGGFGGGRSFGGGGGGFRGR